MRSCWFCSKEGGEIEEWVMSDNPKGLPFEGHEECLKKADVAGELIRKPK